MYITQHTDYALRALIYLGTNDDRLVTIQEIAERFDVSRNHLMKVVNALIRAGFVEGVRGKGGGLRLARAPREIGVGDVLRQMVLKIPALALGIIEGLSFKGRCYSSLAQMLGTRSPTERLAHLLLHLADLYGVEERGGTLIAASFTHADLANMIGVTRQWVTTALKRLAVMGVLDAQGTNILIKDGAPLAKMRDGKSAKNGLTDEAD